MGLWLFWFWEGDVLSGTSSSGVHHAGVLEGWFGEQWWTGRGFVVLVTTLAVLAPLAFSKRIGRSSLFFCFSVMVLYWKVSHLGGRLIL